MTYVRQRPTEIVNGGLADADDVAAELNAIETAFGEIVDSGGTSNSWWIRDLDGNQLVRMTISVSASEPIPNAVFPVPFSSAPTITLEETSYSISQTGGGPLVYTSPPLVAKLGFKSSSGALVRVYNFSTGNLSSGIVDLLAVGRYNV